MYELKARACEAGINPPKNCFRSANMKFIFRGCLDELKAKAIVLDNGATRFLILGMDVGETLNGEQKAEITKKYGFDYEHILTFNTHNHSAPCWGHVPAPRGKKPQDQSEREIVYGKNSNGGDS